MKSITYALTLAAFLGCATTALPDEDKKEVEMERPGCRSPASLPDSRNNLEQDSLSSFLLRGYSVTAIKMKQALQEYDELPAQDYQRIEALLYQIIGFVESQMMHCRRIDDYLFSENKERGYITKVNPDFLSWEKKLFVDECDVEKLKTLYGRSEEVELLLEKHYRRNSERKLQENQVERQSKWPEG